MAQTKPATPAPAKTSGADDSGALVGVMYSFEHLEGDNAPFGVVGNFAKHVADVGTSMGLSVAGEITFNNYTHYHDISFRGGVKMGVRSKGTVKPFFQVLLGGLHYSGKTGYSSGTDFTLLFGGGVLIPVEGKGFNLIVQGGVPVDIYNGAHAGFRADFGLAFNVGK